MDGEIQLLSGLEVVQPVEKILPTAERGRRVEPKGVIEPDDLHVFLSEEVLREVVAWSKSDLQRELGGVFVGDLYSWRGQTYLEVAGYIRARHFHHTATSFRFTHDTWSGITRECEERFNGRLRVGWHHTHPGYGIFLSSSDLFICRHFFNLPWMFALVVDPRQEQLGFFQWKRGEVAELRGFFFVR